MKKGIWKKNTGDKKIKEAAKKEEDITYIMIKRKNLRQVKN